MANYKNQEFIQTLVMIIIYLILLNYYLLILYFKIHGYEIIPTHSKIKKIIYKYNKHLIVRYKHLDENDVDYSTGDGGHWWYNNDADHIHWQNFDYFAFADFFENF